MTHAAEDILTYWLGHVEETGLPSQHRTNIWFGGDIAVDKEIQQRFGADMTNAIVGKYEDWDSNPRSMLALIIIFDQFSRHIFRNSSQAYAQDQKALDLCLKGIQKEYDHSLSLIERVFFYLPLMHAENLEMQATSVRAFQILLNLSFAETRDVFQNFLEHAIKHYEVIKRFGRFPQRNAILGRESTLEEIEFLKNLEAPHNDKIN